MSQRPSASSNTSTLRGKTLTLGVAWCTLLDAYAVASSGKSPPWTATLLQPFRSLQHPRRLATRWLLASRLSRCVALLSCACMPRSCSSSFLPVQSRMFATILGHAHTRANARTRTRMLTLTNTNTHFAHSSFSGSEQEPLRGAQFHRAQHVPSPVSSAAQVLATHGQH